MAVRALIDANIRWSRTTERRLHLPTDAPLWRRFEDEAESLIRALPDGAVVLDLGGGRRCVYGRAVDPPGRVKLVAIDISPEELALNADVTETYVADVAACLPMPDASVDLILSRALLEHVNGVPAAIRHMARVLRPGGVALHLVPCRYSLFGTAARLLPFGPLLWLTHAIMRIHAAMWSSRFITTISIRRPWSMNSGRPGSPKCSCISSGLVLAISRLYIPYSFSTPFTS
jgi:SAM-dependent methyltransferase